MELRYRPKSDYAETAGWEQLYALIEHWKSDLAFYGDELHFLTHLIDKYFIWLVEDDHINHLRQLVARLTKEKETQVSLATKTEKHLSHLATLIKDPSGSDQQAFRGEHAALEDDFSAFVKNFRSLKKEIMNTSKQVLEEEKLKHLLTK